MNEFVTLERACAEYVATERTLELHARRGNLAWRTRGAARLYDAAALAVLFLRRGSLGEPAVAGTLGAIRLGEAHGPGQALPSQSHRRRRRVNAHTSARVEDRSRKAQEA